MSNTGGDDGDGNKPPSPEPTADDPFAALLGPENADLDQTADGDDAQSPQNPDGGGQDTSATEQPQQGAVQGADPVRPEAPGSGSPESASQDWTSVQTPSLAGPVPATPSKGGFMSGLTRWIGGRRASSATPGSASNIPQRSNQPTTSGSRPVSFVEEPGPKTPERQGPELVGPSRRRLNSQGSGTKEGARSPPGKDNAGSRPKRADTGHSIDTEAADLEARGENTATPIGVRNRPSPFGPKSAGGNRGNSPTTPVDSDWVLSRRNRAFVGIFDQMRAYEITDDWVKWQQERSRAEEWEFRLGVNTLDEMAAEGVAGMREVLTAAEARVPADVQTQIIEETERRAQEARNRVNNGLEDERIYVENTAKNIIDLMERSSPTLGRRRGTSRVSGRLSLDSQATQPELPPLDPEALRRNSKEELIDKILALEQARREAVDATTELEDQQRETQQAQHDEREQWKADANKARREDERRIGELERESDHFRKLAEAASSAAPTRQDPVGQPPSQSSPDGSEPAVPTRSPAGSPPRSPAREQTFTDLTNLLTNLGRHEDLVRQLRARAGLNPQVLDANTAPFSENAQLSRTQLLVQLRDVTESREQLRQERERLAEQVARLEDARVSPPSRPGTGLFGNLFGSNRRDSESSSGNSRSRSDSHADRASTQNIVDELEAQGGPSDPGSRQSPRSRGQSEAGSRRSTPSGNRSAGSRRQSEAGSRQSDGSSSNSARSSTPPGAGSRQSAAGSRQSGGSGSQSGGSSTRSDASGGEPDAVNLAPLRVIPEWLATHPDGPCEDCVPVFRFPPELGELPTCGCTCDLALGNQPRSAGGSSGAGSSRSRASSGRSVRFADDGAATGEDNGRRRPAPLNLAAFGGLVDEANDADRPNTPYPAGAEGVQTDAPADATADATADTPAGAAAPDNQPEASAPGDQPEAQASGEQADTVPIQLPEEERPAVQEPAVQDPAVEAPVMAATGGRSGWRCPCCGRGTYGVPPAGGVPQVAYYTCRNMAGQPFNPQAAPPVSLAEGLRNVLAAAAGFIRPRGGGDADAPAAPEPAGPRRRDRGNSAPPAGTEPIAPGTPRPGRREKSAPPATRVPTPEARPEAPPRDRVMTFLTLLWDVYIVALFVRFGDILRPLSTWMGEMFIYLHLRYLVGQNVRRPVLARVPVFHIALFVLLLWLSTMLIALIEERRIWRAANAQLSAAYFRGTALRRPYPFWAAFEADSGLIRPALGTFSQWLHGWYFGDGE